MKSRILNLAERRRFERLVGGLRRDLHRYALWLCRDAQAAEDIVQEAMLRAWRGFEGLAEEAKVRQWLVVIVRREYLRFRERQREQATDPELLALIADRGVDPLVHELRAAILALDEGYREPLALQVLMGHTTDEIAEIMELSQGAVLTRLHRAREKLKQAFVEGGS